MTDLYFMDQAEALLRAVEVSCDRINDHSHVDIDNQRSGSMISLTFPDRSQIIINLQKPLHEVWMAARAGGFHYRLVNGRWIDTKDGSEFFMTLSRCASEQGGLPIRFEP